jgi:hypothetical protein
MTDETSAKKPSNGSGESRLTSFLKSTTGVLTAIGALVVAIAGLVTALTQIGLGGSTPHAAAPPAATPPGAATTVVENGAQRELRSRIPDSILPTCGPPVDPEEGSVAAFNCKYREIDGLQYNLFASSQELDKSYGAIKRRYGLTGTPAGKSCDAGEFEGVYRVADRDAGRLLCFVDDPGHVAAIVWTDDDLDVLSFTWRSDKNLPALFEAWQKGVGPEE